MLALSTGMLCTSSVPFCRRYGCSFSQPRHFATEVWVQRNIMDGANWHHGGRCINRYATAVEVVQVDHSVDARVFRQQVAFDNFNHVVHNVCHAVHAGGNTQQVFGAHAAVGVAVTFKGVIFQRRQRLRHFGRPRQGVKRRRFRQRDRGFVDPAAFGDIAYRVTDNFAIANDFTILRKVVIPFLAYSSFHSYPRYRMFISYCAGACVLSCRSAPI